MPPPAAGTGPSRHVGDSERGLSLVPMNPPPLPPARQHPRTRARARLARGHESIPPPEKPGTGRKCGLLRKLGGPSPPARGWGRRHRGWAPSLAASPISEVRPTSWAPLRTDARLEKRDGRRRDRRRAAYRHERSDPRRSLSARLEALRGADVRGIIGAPALCVHTRSSEVGCGIVGRLLETNWGRRVSICPAARRLECKCRVRGAES